MWKDLCVLVILVVGFWGCSTDDSGDSNSSGGDAAVVDRGTADTGVGNLDTGPSEDTQVADTGSTTDLAETEDTAVAEDTGETEDTANPEDTGEQNDVLFDLAGDGACLNTSDLSALETAPDIEATIGGCVAPCMLEGEACYTTCVKDALGLTDPCAACFGAVMQCTATNCMIPCGLDSGGEACTTCRDDNCSEAFEECSGLPSSM